MSSVCVHIENKLRYAFPNVDKNFGPELLEDLFKIGYVLLATGIHGSTTYFELADLNQNAPGVLLSQTCL